MLNAASNKKVHNTASGSSQQRSNKQQKKGIIIITVLCCSGNYSSVRPPILSKATWHWRLVWFTSTVTTFVSTGWFCREFAQSVTVRERVHGLWLYHLLLLTLVQVFTFSLTSKFHFSTSLCLHVARSQDNRNIILARYIWSCICVGGNLIQGYSFH